MHLLIGARNERGGMDVKPRRAMEKEHCFFSNYSFIVSPEKGNVRNMKPRRIQKKYYDLGVNDMSVELEKVRNNPFPTRTQVQMKM
jgi:hypothetical protein